MPLTVITFIIWTTEKYYDVITAYLANHPIEDVFFDVEIKDEDLISTELQDAIDTDTDIPNLILINDNDIETYLNNYSNTFSSLGGVINTGFYPRYKLIYKNDEFYNFPFSLGNQVLFYRNDLVDLTNVHFWSELTQACTMAFGETNYKLAPGVSKMIRILTE